MKYAALALLLVACGDDSMAGIGGIGGSGGGGGSGGSGGGGPDVTGLSLAVYVSDSAQTVSPSDLVSAPPKAIIGTETIAGFGDWSGNFIIPQVPDGALVQLGATYVQLGRERRLYF